MCYGVIEVREVGFPGGASGEEHACQSRTWVQSPGQEDSLEEGMATQSSNLTWRIPWTEEPGRACGRKESNMTEVISACTHTWGEGRRHVFKQEQLERNS